MTEAWCHELPPPQLLEGVEQFNRGKYFEQHETLEVLWRVETRPVRRLYQGIFQILDSLSGFTVLNGRTLLPFQAGLVARMLRAMVNSVTAAL